MADLARRIGGWSVVWAAVVLAGCGGGGGGGGSGKPGGADEDTLARIKREGVLRWGADPSGGAPYAFYDPQKPESVIGFEVEMMDRIAGHLGVRHEMVKAQWDTLLEGLKARRSDLVMNGLEINEARQKAVDFSQPYYVYEQMLTVRLADKEKYKSLDDLKGKKIGTLSGAEANNVLKRAGWTEAQITCYEDTSTPYTELELARVEAVLQEQMIAEHYAASKEKLYLIRRTFSPGKYAVAVRKGDAKLSAEVDRVLEKMKQNGELAAIYKKWRIWNDAQKIIGVQEAPAP